MNSPVKVLDQLLALNQRYLQLLQMRDFSQALDLAQQVLLLLPEHSQIVVDGHVTI